MVVFVLNFILIESFCLIIKAKSKTAFEFSVLFLISNGVLVSS